MIKDTKRYVEVVTAFEQLSLEDKISFLNNNIDILHKLNKIKRVNPLVIKQGKFEI
jgi:hypothetical protein